MRVIGRKLVEDTVTTFGEVTSVSGYSTQHGPDKKFKYSMVEILVSERTPEVLEALLKQGTS